MSKGSTPTVRETPVADRADATGALRVHARVLMVDTRQRMEVTDLTPRVVDLVRGSGIREGTVNIWPMHTTCAVMINEFQRALLADMTRILEELVARDGDWLHNDPAHSDCDRSNADSHLRAMLLGHSVTLQVSGGEPVLGQWQRVLLAELDGPRMRTLRVQVSGVA
jgi:secondary thiamine-phosphate synthase enzyme